MAIACYYQEKYEKSIDYFNNAYNIAPEYKKIEIKFKIAVCNYLLNNRETAFKQIKELENSNSKENIEILDIAKLYLLLNDFSSSMILYLKASEYYLSVDWFSEKMYCLYKMNKIDIFQNEYNYFIKEKNIEIENNRNNEEFDVEYEKIVEKEIYDFKVNIEKIKNGEYLPEQQFNFYIESNCYYFGCIQHRNNYKI